MGKAVLHWERSPLEQGGDPLGQLYLGPGGGPAVHPLVVGDQFVLLHQPSRPHSGHGLCQTLGAQQFHCLFEEIVLFQTQVTPLLRLPQGVEQGGIHTFRGAGV